LPAEPIVNSAPGKRNVFHSKPVISVLKRPNHHEPEKKIGYSPEMNAVPASSALSPEASGEM